MWHSPSKPKNIKPIPWLHADAIAYLESILNENMDVCEFGGGGSTLWLAPLVKSVTTYENNQNWREVIRQQAPKNVTIFSTPVFFNKFDILIIDGEPVIHRGDWLEYAIHIVKPRGVVVLDNSNRPEYAIERERFSNNADLLYKVNGNGDTHHFLITEFWRLK
jgi:hypothetical protein